MTRFEPGKASRLYLKNLWQRVAEMGEDPSRMNITMRYIGLITGNSSRYLESDQASLGRTPAAGDNIARPLPLTVTRMGLSAPSGRRHRTEAQPCPVL